MVCHREKLDAGRRVRYEIRPRFGHPKENYIPDDETTHGEDAQKDTTSEDVISGHGVEERPDEGYEGGEGEGTGEGTAGPASGSSGPGSGG